MTPAELIAAQQAVLAMHASDALLDYLQALIAATRSGALVRRRPDRRAPASPCCARPGARAARRSATTSRLTTCRPCCRRPIAHRLVPVAGAGRGRVEQVRAMVEAVAAAVSDAAARAAAAESAAACARRFRAWWQRRACRRSDTPLLTQRNIYILPTRAG